MDAFRLLQPLPASHVGMHHLADDRAGTNNRNLDYQVVELPRRVAWNGRHLRSALNLKHPHRIGSAKRVVNVFIVLWKLSKINWHAVVFGYKREAIFHYGHHAE